MHLSQCTYVHAGFVPDETDSATSNTLLIRPMSAGSVVSEIEPLTYPNPGRWRVAFCTCSRPISCSDAYLLTCRSLGEGGSREV